MIEINFMDPDKRLSGSRSKRVRSVLARNADLKIYYSNNLDGIPDEINKISIVKGSTYRLIDARHSNGVTSIKIGSGSVVYFDIEVDDPASSIFNGLIKLFNGEIDLTME